MVSGCASLRQNPSEISIRILSNPPSGQPLVGSKFYTRKIALDGEKWRIGEANVEIPEMVWPSGARRPKHATNLKLDHKKNFYTVTVEHPDSSGYRREFDSLSTRRVNVTFKSNPEGATIVSGGQNFGRSPVVLGGDLTYDEYRYGQKRFSGVSAHWPSGAKKKSGEIILDIKRGMNWDWTFQRPTNQPGVEIDVKAAIEYEKLKLLKKEQAAKEQRRLQEQMYQQELLALEQRRISEEQKARDRNRLLQQMNSLSEQIRENTDRTTEIYRQYTPRSGSGTITTPGLETYRYKWTEW
jgi:hypothetical protein